MFTVSIFMFLVCFASYISAQTCPTCPVNGIWSEWTTTETCNTTCGACSTINRSRTCLSTVIGCPCVGNSTSTIPCNTQACVVVQSNSKIEPCCNNVTATLINYLYYCVAPEEPAKLECCPAGGYWTNWSDYEKVPDRVKWRRTRTCLSDGANCPCTGEEEDSTNLCPCVLPVTIRTAEGQCQAQNPAIANTRQAVFIFSHRPQVLPRLPTCDAYSILEESNYLANFNWINTSSTSTTPITVFASIDTAGKCTFETESIGNVGTSGGLTRIWHTCNLKTLRFERGSMTGMAKVSQFYNL